MTVDSDRCDSRESSPLPLLAVCASSPLGFVSVAPARAQIAFTPCARQQRSACGHLTVPLDPSGRRRGRSPWRSAATGAGRRSEGRDRRARGRTRAAGDPVHRRFARLLGPITATRDLIVFDQRGIGLSHPLSCHRFELGADHASPAPRSANARAQIGPRAAYYTTGDTVADIEAIRRGGGYEKLVLYGTSYGTKVAEDYAQAYPEHVEASCSTRSSAQRPRTAQPSRRSQRFPASFPSCAHRAPVRTSPADPVRISRELVRRRHVGRCVVADRRPRPAHTGCRSPPRPARNILIEGDLEPIAAQRNSPRRCARRPNGDTAALARLASARGSGGESEAEAESERDLRQPALLRDDLRRRAVPVEPRGRPTTRLAEAQRAIKARGPRAIAPFTPRTCSRSATSPACAFWPFSTPAPAPVRGALPERPDADPERRRRPAHPDRQRSRSRRADPRLAPVGVPTPGTRCWAPTPPTARAMPCRHCSRQSDQALRGRAAAADPALTPLAPTRLARLAAAQGNHGLPGRTLEAVTLTLADFTRQLPLQLIAARVGQPRRLDVAPHAADCALAGSTRWEGICPSTATPRTGRHSIRAGSLSAEKLELRIGGSAAAQGTLKLGAITP